MLVPAVFQLLYCNFKNKIPYKMNTSLRWTFGAGPDIADLRKLRVSNGKLETLQDSKTDIFSVGRNFFSLEKGMETPRRHPRKFETMTLNRFTGNYLRSISFTLRGQITHKLSSFFFVSHHFFFVS